MKRKYRMCSGTTDNRVSIRELENRKLARRAAAEGIVLLKNEAILPLENGKKVAVFGSGAVNIVKGGTGGGNVNEREVVNVCQGVVEAGLIVCNKEWLESFKSIYQKAREEWRDKIFIEAERTGKSVLTTYSANPFKIPTGVPIRENDLEDADIVLYVIGRTAGEGKDRELSAGDYFLTNAEKEDLVNISQYGKNMVVIINSGGQIDLKDIINIPNVKGLIYMAQPGMEGGHALADVLTGKVTPSGKLVDTWALNYQDFPNAESFSYNSGDTQKEYYVEGLYVGYRYFDSFEKKVAYPFGYGLSYTEFSITVDGVLVEGNQVKTTLSVKNVGDTFSGKEVVQIYVSCPQSRFPKEHKKLCAFNKTKLLAPGESEQLNITFDSKNLAVYNEEQAAWLVESGLYGIWIGNSSQSVSLSGVLQVESEVLLEKVQNICRLQDNLEELVCPYEMRRAKEEQWHMLAEEKGLKPILFRPIETPIVKKTINDAAKWASELVEKLTDDELINMVVGRRKNDGKEAEIIGVAGIKVPGSAGETSPILEEKYNVPSVVMADGPAGLRLLKSYEINPEDGRIYDQGALPNHEGGFFAKQDNHDNAVRYYQYCTAFPVGTLLAQTWDSELLEEVGKAVGLEMQEFGVAWWLAPGLNIHRNPLCGRNFEYFSEDPVLSGKIAAAITRGVQSLPGVGTTLKHFACNNQEDNRMGSDSILSERVLREIYLRGFEIAVKESQPMAIMTSYNLINGLHTANSKELCTQVARKEWDFQGIIMTDWTTTMPWGGSVSWKCIDAGNDLIMPGKDSDIEDICQALENGTLGRKELKECVQRILTIIFQTLEYEDVVCYGAQFTQK